MRRDKSQSMSRTAYRHPAVTGGAFVSAAFLAALLASPTAASAVPLKRPNGTNAFTSDITVYAHWERIFAAVNNWDSLNYFKHFIDILAYKVI